LASASLSNLYRAYIDCLNRQDWDRLGQYVDDEVEHNGRPVKLSGYRDMLVKDFEDIPDLRFNIQLLACSRPLVAARLAFKCSPKGKFLGLSVNGRMVSFAENVFTNSGSPRSHRSGRSSTSPLSRLRFPSNRQQRLYARCPFLPFGHGRSPPI
jgi:predicted ester cyclase